MICCNGGVECVSVARIISRIKGDLAYGRVFSPEGGFARALIGKRIKGILQRSGYPFSSMEESVWGAVLDRVQPLKVVGIQPSRELCVACHKRGIWVADVQHGVIGDGHPWYAASTRGADPVEFLPDAFLCWDRESQMVIDSWGAAKKIRTHAIGNRWIARFRKLEPHDRLVNNLTRKFDSQNTNDIGRPSILVSLSWGEADIPNGFMVDGLRDTIRATADQYHWSVRLHPNQLNGFATDEGSRFRTYFRENLEGLVEWEAATKTALPAVLRTTDLAISWNSSVCIEAAIMGIPAAQLDPKLRGAGKNTNNYRRYGESGKIGFVDANPESLGAWIVSALNSPRQPEEFDEYDQEYSSVLDFLAR